MMNQIPKFTWYEATGTTICEINNIRTTAQCHPDDRDFMTRRVGEEIAAARAEIISYCQYRDNVLIPGLAALKQLYYSINHSKQYNKKSYEARMLYRQIQMKENDLKEIRAYIKELKEGLRSYIRLKDKGYEIIRAKRASDKKVQSN